MKGAALESALPPPLSARPSPPPPPPRLRLLGGGEPWRRSADANSNPGGGGRCRCRRLKHTLFATSVVCCFMVWWLVYIAQLHATIFIQPTNLFSNLTELNVNEDL